MILRANSTNNPRNNAKRKRLLSHLNNFDPETRDLPRVKSANF